MSLTVTALRKSFGSHVALDDISFEVPNNAFFCVVGPSGCGKSTLLRAIAGLERPDAGRIALNGTAVFDAQHKIDHPPEARRVGVVFQSYALWPHLTVRENVAFPYEAQGMARKEAKRHASAHLETVDLAEYAERRPEALSGGQRQRVALARCLAGQTNTILMDEPLANLDPHLRHAMEGELQAFHRRSGVTTLFITHDQREAMALADLMAVMDGGRFLQFGTPEEIYERPANETVARFIGRGSFLPAKVADGQAQLLGQTLPVESNRSGPCRLFVRPRHIIMDPDGWAATITTVTYRGGHWEAVARVSEGAAELLLELPQRAQPGEILRLRLTQAWALPG